jgi:hypothetical protein
MVSSGSAKKTSGGLTTTDIKKNKSGKLVSKRASESAKKKYASNKLIQAWRKLVLSNFKKGSGSGGLKAAMQKSKAQWPAIKRAMKK